MIKSSREIVVFVRGVPSMADQSGVTDIAAYSESDVKSFEFFWGDVRVLMIAKGQNKPQTCWFLIIRLLSKFISGLGEREKYETGRPRAGIRSDL